MDRHNSLIVSLEFCASVIKAAPMQDLKKIAVDDLNFKKIAINGAHYHHEKWNGSGYPEKLAGVNIPLEAILILNLEKSSFPAALNFRNFMKTIKTTENL